MSSILAPLLKKRTSATGGNYVWNILRDTTVEVSPTTGIASFADLCVYEGSIVSFNML